MQRYVPINTGHVWPTLPLRRIPKQVGGFAYQVVLASPVVGRRVGASRRVLRSVFNLISIRTDAVLDGFDKLRRARTGARVAEHVDDVRIEYLADCGHFPPEEQPELVAEHLRAFFGT